MPPIARNLRTWKPTPRKSIPASCLRCARCVERHIKVSRRSDCNADWIVRLWKIRALSGMHRSGSCGSGKVCPVVDRTKRSQTRYFPSTSIDQLMKVQGTSESPPSGDSALSQLASIADQRTKEHHQQRFETLPSGWRRASIEVRRQKLLDEIKLYLSCNALLQTSYQ